jgi:hypothetical protein
MNDLQASIKAIKVFEPPDLSMFYGLIAEMDRAAPFEIFVKRWVGKIRRVARLAFVSQVCGRHIESFRELWGAELYLIGEWFAGHRDEYARWCVANVEVIHRRAGVPASEPEEERMQDG